MSDEKSNVIHRAVVARQSGEFVVVSTVDLRFGMERAELISAFDSMLGISGGRYESMVFACDATGKVTSYIDLDCARTDYRDGVEAQHVAMVAKWQAAEVAS
jgi:hypothetical protein